MAAKKKAKLVPSRGTAEDWAPEKEAEMLRKKEKYSRKMADQDADAEPDFEQLLKDDLESKDDG